MVDFFFNVACGKCVILNISELKPTEKPWSF